MTRKGANEGRRRQRVAIAKELKKTEELTAAEINVAEYVL